MAGPLELLLVHVAGSRVAIPLSRVLGVAERVPATPLPFSPQGVDGLVLVFGKVMPQLDLRTLLGAAAGDPGGVLVVTTEGADALAIRVDRVVAMAQAERTAPSDPHPLMGDAVVANGTEWRLLDHAAMLAAVQFDLPPPGPVNSLLAGVPEPPPRPPEEHRRPYTLIVVGRETYAIATSEILELLVLDDLRPMPGAPDWVAGLIEWRGMPLLALSAAGLLRQPAGAEAVALTIEHERLGPVALCAARALGIERIGAASIHPMQPPLAGVESYTVGEGGRIIGILSPHALLAAFEALVAPLIPHAPAAMELQVATASTPVRLLTLRVAAEYFAVQADRVERIHAAAQLTPLPADAGFDGMVDVGDAMVPVLDLRRRVDGGRDEGPAPCVLVRFEGSLAGIAVDQVLRLEDLEQGGTDYAATAELPIATVVNLDGRLVSVLAVDRLLPPT